MLMINIELIEKFEGFRSEPYLCLAGKPTIGFGSTFYEDGTPVKLTDEPISRERARQILHWYCENKVKYPEGLNNNQKSAVCSLIYNIGQGAFNRSRLKRAIVSKNEAMIRKEWTWTKVHGVECQGLINRRKQEIALFFKE